MVPGKAGTAALATAPTRIDLLDRARTFGAGKNGGGIMAEQPGDLAIAKSLVRPSAAAEPSKGNALAPTPTFLTGIASPSASKTLPQALPGQVAGPAASAIEPRKLLVGPGITLSGEINSCDHLVVEGSVQANLQGCKHVIIAQSGLFDGNATIDEVEVYGRFEGDLTVRNRLSIRATGHVSGSVSYRQIEIEAGGRISGTIATP
jgi:cytoskeletal protein CcmA (bactofilin family)